MPPPAASKSPGFARRASVKAPASKPKSSASRSVSGIAAAFCATNGPAARGPLSWRIRASSPLPVPVSPVISTTGGAPVPSRVTSRRTRSRNAWIAGESPISRSIADTRASSPIVPAVPASGSTPPAESFAAPRARSGAPLQLHHSATEPSNSIDTRTSAWHTRCLTQAQRLQEYGRARSRTARG